jgi:uncharacterized protein (TIGR02246 family)
MGSSMPSVLESPTAEVAALFDAWNAAVVSGSAERVAALYAADAVLIPTLSNRVRRDPEAITSYFRKFVSRKPRAMLVEADVRVMGSVATHSGVYHFLFDAGPLREARARFTFVYRRDPRGWRIIEHHSSLMPEAEPLALVVS